MVDLVQGSLSFSGKVVSASVGLPANAGAATFDGINDFLTRGADFTGNADSKTGTILVFLKRGTTGVAERIVESDGIGFRIFITSSDLLRVQAENAAGTIILRMTAATALTDTADWHVLLSSWDLASAAGDFYIDDADDDDGVPTLTDDTIDYTKSDWGIGASDAGSAKFTGCLGPIWFAPGTYVDLSVEANRRKFHTAALKVAAALQEDPTSPGATPILYLNSLFDSYEVNQGSGGGLTVTGALTACTGPAVAQDIGLNLVSGSLAVVGKAFSIGMDQLLVKASLVFSGQTLVLNRGYLLQKGNLSITGKVLGFTTDAFFIMESPTLLLKGKRLTRTVGGANVALNIAKGTLTLTGGTFQALDNIQILVKASLNLSGKFMQMSFAEPDEHPWAEAAAPTGGTWVEADPATDDLFV